MSGFFNGDDKYMLKTRMVPPVCPACPQPIRCYGTNKNKTTENSSLSSQVSEVECKTPATTPATPPATTPVQITGTMPIINSSSVTENQPLSVSVSSSDTNRVTRGPYSLLNNSNDPTIPIGFLANFSTFSN